MNASFLFVFTLILLLARLEYSPKPIRTPNHSR